MIDLNATYKRVQNAAKVVVDGNPGRNTWSAISLAIVGSSPSDIVPIKQVIMAVQHALHLKSDGDAGVETWTAIAKHFGVATGPLAIGRPSLPISAFANELAQIAEAQIGTQEDAHHQNRGSAILKFQEATNLGGQGWPWCAAFVDWSVKQALAVFEEMRGIIQRPKLTFENRPETASAFGLIDWAREHHCYVFRPTEDNPQRGDIVVYTFSHTGIVADVDLRHDSFHAIEGNSNVDGSRDGYAVVRHARNFQSVNRFIRIA